MHLFLHLLSIVIEAMNGNPHIYFGVMTLVIIIDIGWFYWLYRLTH